MRFKILLVFLGIQFGIFAQDTDTMLRGSVSFISSQNIYVQFVNTTGIQIGDTLFTLNNNKAEAALYVSNLSSISCICNTINGKK